MTTQQFHTVGSIVAAQDRMRLDKDPRRFGDLPLVPAQVPCPGELCTDGRVPFYGTTAPCVICDGTGRVPALPLNRAALRNLARSLPRVIRKRVFGRIAMTHRPQRSARAQ